MVINFWAQIFCNPFSITIPIHLNQNISLLFIIQFLFLPVYIFHGVLLGIYIRQSIHFLPWFSWNNYIFLIRSSIAPLSIICCWYVLFGNNTQIQFMNRINGDFAILWPSIFVHHTNSFMPYLKIVNLLNIHEKNEQL